MKVRSEERNMMKGRSEERNMIKSLRRKERD